MIAASSVETEGENETIPQVLLKPVLEIFPRPPS